MNGWIILRLKQKCLSPDDVAQYSGDAMKRNECLKQTEPSEILILVKAITRTKAIAMFQYPWFTSQQDKGFTCILFKPHNNSTRKVKFQLYKWKKIAQKPTSAVMKLEFSCLQSPAFKHNSTWISQMAAAWLLLSMHIQSQHKQWSRWVMVRAMVWSLSKKACSFVCSACGEPFSQGPPGDSGFLGNLSDSLLNTKHTFKKGFFKKVYMAKVIILMLLVTLWKSQYFPETFKKNCLKPIPLRS